MVQIRQLQDRLAEFLTALEELKSLLLQDREDIVGLNPAGLDARRMAMVKSFGTVQDLSDRSTIDIKSACAQFGIVNDIGLPRLIAALSSSEGAALTELRTAIIQASGEVENALSVNKALLEDSLSFTNQSMQMLTGMLKNSSFTYGQEGRYRESVDQPRIICKEI